MSKAGACLSFAMARKGRMKYYADADLITRENGGKEVLPKKNLVIIGIKHQGDENGLTTYCQGYIVAKKKNNGK